MDDVIGSYYIIKTITSFGLTHVFGKLVRIEQNVFGSRFSAYVLDNCIVSNNEESFRVSRPITFWSNNIIEKTKVEPMAEAMIYALSHSNLQILDADTVEQMVSSVSAETVPEQFRNPGRTALNVEGEAEEEEEQPGEEEHFDYGGMRRRKRSKRTRNQRKQRRSKKSRKHI
jgi:hypothetical protein